MATKKNTKLLSSKYHIDKQAQEILLSLLSKAVKPKNGLKELLLTGRFNER